MQNDIRSGHVLIIFHYIIINIIMMMKKFQEWVLVLRDLSVCLELVDYILVVLTSCNHSELQLSKKS